MSTPAQQPTSATEPADQSESADPTGQSRQAGHSPATHASAALMERALMLFMVYLRLLLERDYTDTSIFLFLTI